jgi:two-component system invasion response regulator UvrY
MINVLLVNNRELADTGFEALLNDVEDITVVGVAKSDEEAFAAIGALRVDVVLMDVNMPGIGDREACRILQKNPKAKIIIT